MVFRTFAKASASSIVHGFGMGAITQQLRRFSMSAPRSHTYLVWAPDYTDEGALARRMAVRPKHFIRANKQIKQGILKVAGGLITPETQGHRGQKFVGSVLLYEANSIEDVRSLIKEDIYWTENVWDKEKLMIHPMLMATTLQDQAGITQPSPED
ncbi:hypothetical protein JVU11DRAFT_2445 [Chiua virens]|nr:hypothetical protein JVU11DRAFT_2445 [Chiua virens]